MPVCSVRATVHSPNPVEVLFSEAGPLAGPSHRTDIAPATRLRYSTSVGILTGVLNTDVVFRKDRDDGALDYSPSGKKISSMARDPSESRLSRSCLM